MAKSSHYKSCQGGKHTKPSHTLLTQVHTGALVCKAAQQCLLQLTTSVMPASLLLSISPMYHTHTSKGQTAHSADAISYTGKESDRERDELHDCTSVKF